MPEEQNNPFAEFGGEVVKKEANPFAEFGGELKKKDQPTRSGYSVTPLPSQDKFDIGEEVATIGYKSPIGKAIQKDKIKGSNVAGVYNTLVGSLSSIVGGGVYMADILGAQPSMPLSVRIANADADRKKAVSFIEQARSSRSSKEFEQQQSEFDVTPKEGGGLFSGVDFEDVRGLAFQAPKTLLEMAAGAYSGGLTFAQQSINDNAKELEESGEGKKLTDVQKVGYLFTQAAAQAALEKFSIDKILKNTGLAKSIQKKITAEVIEGFAQKGIKATAKEVQDEMVKKAAKLSTKLKNVGIKGVESAFVEGSTEGIQQAASDAIKVATNKIAEKEVFNEEDINKNFWKNVVNNAVMGAAMGGATGAGLQGLNSTDKAIRQEIANATGEKKFYVDDKEVTEKEFGQSTGNKKVTTDLQNIQDQINKQVEEGNLTPEEAEAANITAQQYAEIAGKIPTTVSKEDKYKIIGGISQRNQLQEDLQKAREEMMQVDPIFRKEKQDQIDLIQAKIDETGDYLEGLATGKKPRYIKRDGRKGEETTYYKVDENGDKTPISQARYDLAKAIKKEDSRKKAPVDENRRRRVEQFDILYGVKSNNPEFDFPNSFEEFNKKIDSDPNYLSDLYKRAKKYKETGEIAEDEMGTEASFIEAINPPVEKDITIGEIVDKKGTYKDQKGTFLQEGDNVVFENEASGEKYEIGKVSEIQEKPASEFDIKYDESLVSIDDKGNISVREKPYINRYSNPLKAINKDENGNIVSVNLETADGKKRTFKGSIAEDIAYQINLKEKSKEAPKVEPKAEQVVEKPVQVVKPVKPVVEVKEEVKPFEELVNLIPTADLKRPNGSIGTQGFTEENIINVARFIASETGFDIPIFDKNLGTSKIKQVIEYLKNNKEAQQKIKEYVIKDPVVTSLLPDGTYEIEDGNHRANLLNLIGVDAIPTIELSGRDKQTAINEHNAKVEAIEKSLPTKEEPTEVKEQVKPTKVEEIKTKIKSKLKSFKERFAPVKKTSTKGEKIAEAKDVYKKVKEMDAPSDGAEVGLRYLADGGIVSQAVVDEIAGTTANVRATLNTGRKVKTKSEESKSRDYVSGNESLDDLVHRLWEVNKQRIDIDDIKEALMDEIGNNNTRFDAAKAYLERYSPEYTQKSYEDRMSEQMQAEEEEFRRKLEEEGLEEAPFAVREATTEDIESMQEIVADYVKDGVTALDDIKREVAKELGYNTKALRQIVEDAYNRYTTTTEVAPAEVLGAIADRVGNKMKQMFGKAAQAPVILNDANSMLDKAVELGASGEVIEFQKEQAKQQKGASISDKTAIDELRSKTEDKAKISIIDAAEKMITTLKSVLPNFDIVIHGSNESYNAAMKDAEIDGVVGGVGNFSYSKKKGEYSGRIDINLNRANNKTLAHEVAHGVMLKAFGDNPKLFKEFREKIASVLNESDNQTLIDFADRATYAKNDTYEEYLAELTAMLAEQETKLSTSTFQKIAAIINDIIEKITNGAFKPFKDIKKTKQVVDFFNDISESIRKGEAIKIENIKTAEELKKQAKLELEDFERIATESIADIARMFGMDLGNPVASKAQVPVEKLPRPVINGFDVLKKKFGETAAKAIRSKIQIAINYPTEFIDFITAKIPIKEDVSFIVDKMGDNLDGLFRIAIQKNSEAADAKGKTPEELSKEAGYVFYKPKSNDDLIVFKKDFKEFEVLCTFNDPSRINNNVIFWLRRNNAETVLHAREVTQEYLKEESEGAILWRDYLDKKGLKKDDGSYDLSNLDPRREDPYGTSSMSVQIGRTGTGPDRLPIGKPSIKNRYNHRVDAPDETFDSNLDNIISGLEKAVYSIEGVPERRNEIGRQPSLPDYIHKDNQGRLFKYDQQINGVYISKNGYYDGNLHIIDKSTQKIVDDYLIDSKNKTANSLVGTRSILTDINKISFDKNTIKIQSDKGSLNLELVDGVLDKISGDIARLENSFMFYNKSLTSIDLPSVKSIGNDFLYSNETLRSVNLPLVERIGDEFLNRNIALENIDLPLVSIIGTQFLNRNVSLENVNMPSAVIIGDDFLKYNEILENLDLPSVQMVGYNFLYNNKYLKSANLPNIRVVSEAFLSKNQSLKNIDFPLLVKVPSSFLSQNENIEEVNLPLVTEIGSNFLGNNKYLKKLNLPLVKSIESEFLPLNNILEEINLPLVEKIGSEFLLYNESLTTISLPSVKNIGSRFMKSSVLTSINLPLVEGIDREFLEDNRRLESINLPSAELIGNDFLSRNQYIKSVELPLVKYVGNRFLSNARELINIKLPSVKIIGDKFLYVNKFLTNIDLPLVNAIGEDFLYNNESLSSIKLPLVDIIGSDFLHNNKSLTSLDLPLVTKIGYDFLFENKSLAKINLPSVINISSSFLKYNEALTSIDLPLVESIGNQFLFFNESLENINLPNVLYIRNDFLYSNESFLKTLKLPKVVGIGSDFLHYNNSLTTLELPKVERIDDDFLFNNMSLENLELPSIKIFSPNGFFSKNKVLANKIALASMESAEVRSKAQMPMFMANQNGEDILGFSYDNRMYLNGEKLNPNTIIHEAGHIWTEWIKNNDTKLYDKGMELVEKSPYLQKAKNSKFYQEQADKLATEEQREAYFKHEALAMAIGDKGAQFVLESKKESFQDWLKTLWTKIKNLTGFKDLTAEEFQNLTFDQFSKMAVKEILGTEGAVDKLNAIKSFRNKKKFIKDNLKYESNKNAIDELDFTEEDFIEIAKSNFDLSTFKNIKDAVQKRSTKKVLQPKQGEDGEARGGRRRVEPRVEGERIADEEGETTQPEGITQIPEEIQNVGLENQDIDYVRITKAELGKLRESLGLPAYKGLPIENREMLREAAQEMIKKGVSVESLYDKIRRGDVLSNYENAFMAEYRAALDVELKNNPSQELLKKIAEFADIFQQGASLAGKALESLKIMKKLNEANTLSNFLLTRQEDKGFPLTPKMMVEETAKFEKVQKAKKELKESVENDIINQVKTEAENELKKEGKAKVKKSHEEFVKERKAALVAAKEALKKLRSGEQGLMVSAPGLNELVAIAPHMNKYVKSLFAEGVSKLDDIVTEVHKEFSELVDGLTKRDVLDVIAGKHNLKKRTADELNAGLRLLRREAELLALLEKARLGEEEAKSESQMAEKSKRVQELERKIKEVKALNKAKELAEEGVEEKSPTIGKDGVADADYNQKRQKYLDKKIKKLEDDLKNKNYDKEAKETIKYKVSDKTKKMTDRVIELEKAIALERYKDQTNKLSKWEKAWDKIQSVLGIRRIVQTAVDASIWFRQLAKLTLNPRKWGIARKFIFAGAQSVFSQKNYDRLMYGIHQAPDFEESVKDGIRYNELDSIDPKKQNEMFPKSFVFKIPILRELITASQRIADASLNVARYELYNKYKRELLRKGITRESDPNEYEQMAKLVMNSTGSGNMLEILESRKAEKVMGSLFYGARLMAANINTLNPVYYVRMPKEVRKMAMKDLASYTTTVIATTLAFAAAGGAVSMDPDDPEFLQVRFNGKVYDFTAGQAAYIRTFLRWVEFGYARAAKSKFEANEAGAFAWRSTLSFFRNKLAPNNAYLINAATGKNSIGQDFDPMEIFHVYPMYADDAYEAAKEDGFVSLLTVLMPNILGIGYSSYYSDKAMKPMDEVINRAQNSDELDPESVKKGITKKEFEEFAKLRDKLIAEKIAELYQEGVYDAETQEYVPIKKSTPENITAAIMQAKSAATKEAKSEFNADDEE